MKRMNKNEKQQYTRIYIVTFIFLWVSSYAFAQNGEAGINEATRLVSGYFVTAQKLLYAIGGVVGIVGAVKVYNKWSHGDQDTNKTAAAWFGACIFFVVVATVLKNFFGL